ncbi:MAG: hypothetical protein Q7U74_08770 [Saprospiraceae bacterium]|nr:hypothetical protein [Saprospiraceae bacterium]
MQLALHLHKLTGEHVVFFPMIDPPTNWKEAVKGTDFELWWRRELTFGHPFDEILVARLSSFFGLRWSELPALVISPSLWNGAYITVPTSADLIEAQFQVLTDLANQIDHPSLEDIEHQLQHTLGCKITRINENARFLVSFFEFLETYDRSTNRFNKKYWALLRNELVRIRPLLSEMRKQDIKSEDTDENSQSVIQLVTDLLIAPAHIASLSYGDRLRKSQSIDIPTFEFFEPDSQITVKSAAQVGAYIEFLNNLSEPFLHVEDFTPAAQGYWKAYENEMNYSLVQVERACLGIDWRNYYTLYDPAFPENRSYVETPQKKYLNKQVDGVSKHKFLPLGDNWYVFENLLGAKYTKLGFRDLLTKNFGFVITDDFTDIWGKIREIRNEGSHVAPLNKGLYERLFDLIRNAQAFPPLVELKQKLKAEILH